MQITTKKEAIVQIALIATFLFQFFCLQCLLEIFRTLLGKIEVIPDCCSSCNDIVFADPRRFFLKVIRRAMYGQFFRKLPRVPKVLSTWLSPLKQK